MAAWAPDEGHGLRVVMMRAQLAQARRLGYRDAATRYDSKGDDLPIHDRNEQREELPMESLGRLAGGTVASVEYDEADFVVIRVGEFTLYADDPSLYGPWPPAGLTEAQEAHSARWATFREAALALLRSGEADYAIVHQAVETVEDWYEQEAANRG